MYVDPTGHIFGIDDLIIGIIVGAVIGGIVAAATGGDIWMGVATGAIGGALFGAVGFTGVGGLAHTIGHATAGALSGGISSVMRGGDVIQGALIGAFSAGASEWMGTNVPFLRDTEGKNFADYLGNVIRRSLIGGVVGGTTSLVTGGDFWQGAQYGAMTSAIAYTANDWMHMQLRYMRAGTILRKGFNTLFKAWKHYDWWDITSYPFQDTNYGGASKMGPGEPTSPLDVAFKTHDETIRETGAHWWNIKNEDVWQAHKDLMKSALDIGVSRTANAMERSIFISDPIAIYKRLE